MKLTILCVGKLKERYFADAVDEYLKRLKPYANVQIIEVADEKAPDKITRGEAELIKGREAARLEKHIASDSYNIALAIDGESMSTERLERHMSALALNGRSHFTFIIGGSIGISENIADRCNLRLSFSPMTFPHQLMRVILLEQIYRIFKIRCNEPYHK